MTHPTAPASSISALVLALVTGCARGDDSEIREQVLDGVEEWIGAGVDLLGQVVDEGGAPVAGATVRLGGFTAVTDARGVFRLAGLERANAILTVEAEGFRASIRAVHLELPLGTDETEVVAVLVPRREGSARLLFAGDAAMGRRFLDTDESTPRGELPPDDPNAWIQVSDPEPGTAELVRHVAPLFDATDYRVINLETPVTADPATPNTEKEYVFFTLPGSLAALVELGVDGVSLGNNHVYDYLDPGIAHTLANVRGAGLDHGGAGLDADEAWTPWHADLEGHAYAFVSATSITGDQYETGFVATEDRPGAADLTDDDRFDRILASEIASGRTPVALFHAGEEYQIGPSDYQRDRALRAAVAGVPLVVGHHSHAGLGFGAVDGTLVAWSLGNFVLDQDRLETFHGEALVVDLRGDERLHAEVVPLVLDEYRPLPVAGESADRFLRTIAESTEAPLVVAGQAGTGWLLEVDDPRVAYRDRAVDLPVLVRPDVSTLVDLRSVTLPGESLSFANLEGPADARGRLGRDLLSFGSFEDDDVDDEVLEESRWDLEGESRALCVDEPRRGAAALCSFRDDQHHEDSITPFRHRIRLRPDATGFPGTDVTVLAWMRGSNAGEVSVEVRWMASEGDRRFGQDTCLGPSGSFDWTMVSCDLEVPGEAGGDPERDPGAIRLWLHQAPPDVGAGLAVFDDVAVVSWEDALDLAAGADLSTPHGRDFLRIDAAPGAWNLHLVLRSVVPAATP